MEYIDILFNVIKTVKMKYEIEEEQAKVQNNKDLWKCVNKIIKVNNKKKKSVVDHLFQTGVKSHIDIVNHFNTLFVT